MFLSEISNKYIREGAAPAPCLMGNDRLKSEG
jgi:hypothetical protein